MENKQYRILFFFHGREAVILTRGLTKEREVPKIEIDKAIESMNKYLSDPDKHKKSE